MSRDLSLVIFDPLIGCVVRERWIGMRATYVKAVEILDRKADRSNDCCDCWIGVTPGEAIAIAEAHYADGGTPNEVAAYAKAFPVSHFWWSIELE